MLIGAMITFRQQIISRIAVRTPHDLAQLATRWWAAIAAELIPPRHQRLGRDIGRHRPVLRRFIPSRNFTG